MNDDHGDRFMYSTRRYQFIFALALGIIIWSIFHSNHPWTEPIKQWITKGLSHSVDIPTVAMWYDRRFSGFPAMIPIYDDSKSQPLFHQYPIYFNKPVNGLIIRDFDQSLAGIMIQPYDKAQLYAVRDGLVSFVGIKENNGLTMVIRHQHGYESIYANISNNLVQVSDKVISGQGIGLAQEKPLYFALYKDGHAIDPVAVIDFE